MLWNSTEEAQKETINWRIGPMLINNRIFNKNKKSDVKRVAIIREYPNDRKQIFE